MFSRRSTAPKPSDSSVHGSERSSRSGSTGHAGTPTTDSGGIIQNVTSRYLKKESLQALLEDLFPEQTDFKIRQREDLWCFTAPRKVEESEIDRIRDF
ncbi:hypothetical protein B0T22DRAFT_449738 [Podospora appendiculata]|uniref:Uncharacterized protein n=1 Tax=Podospora appendiculata TaxID=314037 RepID=A0AAE1CGF1_9PEZI|nr:hypothetical protein B0T22DRAFT_449738 [Podospora appendiculata]